MQFWKWEHWTSDSHWVGVKKVWSDTVYLFFGETLLWQQLHLNCLLCVLDSSKSVSLNVGLFVRSTSVVEKTKNTLNKESEIWMQRKGSTHGLGFHETKGCSERKLGGNAQKLKIYGIYCLFKRSWYFPFYSMTCDTLQFLTLVRLCVQDMENVTLTYKPVLSISLNIRTVSTLYHEILKLPKSSAASIYFQLKKVLSGFPR